MHLSLWALQSSNIPILRNEALTYVAMVTEGVSLAIKAAVTTGVGSAVWDTCESFVVRFCQQEGKRCSLHWLLPWRWGRGCPTTPLFLTKASTPAESEKKREAVECTIAGYPPLPSEGGMRF